MSKNGQKILRNILRQLKWLLPSSKEGNVKAMFLAIFIATTFWFFNALNKSDYSTRVNYPVEFEYNPDSTFLLSPLPENITVEVSGGGWNLLRKTLLFDRPPVRINLDSPTTTKFIDVQSESVKDLVENRLEDVNLDYILTDTLYLNIDKTSSKTAYVSLDTSKVNLAPKYRIISKVKFSPDTVNIYGPASIVSKLPDTVLVSMPNDKISSDFSDEVSLEVSEIELLQVSPEEVNVNFEIAPFSLYEKEIPISTINFPASQGVSLEEEYVKISFWLQNNYVELANNYTFQVVANYRALNSSDSTVTPVLKSYPDFAKDITITPSKVKVNYAK